MSIVVPVMVVNLKEWFEAEVMEVLSGKGEKPIFTKEHEENNMWG